jgi:hypothetical protein
MVVLWISTNLITACYKGEIHVQNKMEESEYELQEMIMLLRKMVRREPWRATAQCWFSLRWYLELKLGL